MCIDTLSIFAIVRYALSHEGKKEAARLQEIRDRNEKIQSFERQIQNMGKKINELKDEKEKLNQQVEMNRIIVLLESVNS